MDGVDPKSKIRQGSARHPPAIATLPAAIVEGNLPLVLKLMETVTDEFKVAKQKREKSKSTETPHQNIVDLVLSICCDNADRGCTDVLKYVLANGAKPNPATIRQDKSTPLLRTLHCYDKLNPDGTNRVNDEVLRGQRIKDCAKLLIEKGADVHAKDQHGQTALFRAVLLQTHLPAQQCAGCTIAELLLQHKSDVNATDSNGRTVLFAAIWRNHVSVVRSLIGKGVNLGQTDERGRTVWHHLAGDPDRVWDHDSMTIAELLLSWHTATNCLGARDEQRKTCLHWAAATGSSALAKRLLDHPSVDINALEYRFRTPLWVAVKYNRKDVVDVFLDHETKVAGIDLDANQGWTPLHIACHTHSSIEIVQRLLEKKADPNRRTQTGKTPLHIACEAGNQQAVESLLNQKSVRTNIVDNYGNTPLLGAALGGHGTIVDLLAPWTKKHIESLSPDAKSAADKFSATILNFGRDFTNGKYRRTEKVFDVLYSDPRKSSPKCSPISTLCKTNGSTKFRWIHLPVNNVSWCHELLTKRFIEEGAHDVEGFKALERSFNYQHRGEKLHSSFMRPMCQTVSCTLRKAKASETTETGRPLSDPSLPSSLGRTGTNISATSDLLSAPKECREKVERKFLPATINDESQQAGQPGKSPKDATEKHQKARGSKPASGLAEDEQTHPSHNVFMFAPYLHFETNKERREMQDAIRRAGLQPNQGTRKPVTFTRDARDLTERTCDDGDELLIRAHLNKLEPSSSTLHLRRTLDQFFYRTIDTDMRDDDQVIYKYEKKKRERNRQTGIRHHSDDLKVIMVDQLWMWIMGNDLIVTSFPQRWRQPRVDPMNVLESIIQELHLSTGDDVESVYDLAIFIAGRCFGTFDRDGSRFLDMFESSIGEAMDDETHLFERFKHAARNVSQFLARKFGLPEPPEHEKAVEEDSHRPELRSGVNYEDQPNGADRDGAPTQAIQTLLHIGMEAKLLSEVKDIRDELDMLKMVFQQQKHVLPQANDAVDIIIGSKEDEESNALKCKLHKRFNQYARAMDHSIEEIERMDKQAERIYSSIRDLLDLKQKHANAFEAQYARVQATETARQGLTIMVFTIVTVIFLPLSFIAAFLGINIEEFPHRNGTEKMSLSFVCTYVFGIGLPIGLISVIAALSIRRIAPAWKATWTSMFPSNPRKSQAVPAKTGTSLIWNSAAARKVDEEAFGVQSRPSWRSAAGTPSGTPIQHEI